MISTPGDVPASLARLHAAGLVHRWNDLVTATHAACHFHEITQSLDSTAEGEHHHDNAVLESPDRTRQRRPGPTLRAGDSGRRSTPGSASRRPDITDALDRLDAAGPHRTPRRTVHRLRGRHVPRPHTDALTRSAATVCVLTRSRSVVGCTCSHVSGQASLPASPLTLGMVAKALCEFSSPATARLRPVRRAAPSEMISSPDGWSPPPSCYPSPRSRCAMWRGWSAIVSRPTLHGRSGATTGFRRRSFEARGVDDDGCWCCLWLVPPESLSGCRWRISGCGTPFGGLF